MRFAFIRRQVAVLQRSWQPPCPQSFRDKLPCRGTSRPAACSAPPTTAQRAQRHLKCSCAARRQTARSARSASRCRGCNTRFQTFALKMVPIGYETDALPVDQTVEMSSAKRGALQGGAPGGLNPPAARLRPTTSPLPGPERSHPCRRPLVTPDSLMQRPVEAWKPESLQTQPRITAR